MIKLIIDINHNEVAITNVVQGIKLFANKNKHVPIVVVGDENNVLTLKGVGGIELIYTNKIYESVTDLANEDVSLTKAFKLLSEATDSNTILVTCAGKEVIKLYSEKYLQKVSPSPLFITSYPNALNGKTTYLSDTGYTRYPNYSDFINQADLAIQYVSAVTSIEDPKFKLLSPSSSILDDEFLNEIDKRLTSFTNYEGVLSCSDILEPETRLVVGQSSIIEAMTNSIFAGINTYDKYIKNGIENNAMYRFGYTFNKNLFANIESSIDKKMSAAGTVLLGYDKLVVEPHATTTPIGIASCLETARKLANDQIAKLTKK